MTLTIDEQRELLVLVRQLAGTRKSLSSLRPPGKDEFDSAAALTLLVERLAVGYGDRQAILLLKEIANADPATYPDRQQDATLARQILAKVDPAFMQVTPKTMLKKVPGPRPGDPPYPDGQKATMVPEGQIPPLAIPLQDDAPGYPAAAGPGPERDAQWLRYFTGTKANGFTGTKADGTSRTFGGFPRALPNPEAVQDPGLRVIGAAARQQGVSYAWGANQSLCGPSRGTLAGDPPDGGAHTYHDDQRIGFDCGGLVRFAVAQGTGKDPFECRLKNPGNCPGTDRIDASNHLTPITKDKPLRGSRQIAQRAEPGDILVFSWQKGHQACSGEGTHHTGIYIGNGVILNAHGSGTPIKADKISDTWEDEYTDVLRPQ